MTRGRDGAAIPFTRGSSIPFSMPVYPGAFYLSHFTDYAMPDTMTVRNKLNEYASAGLLAKQKKGKTLHYYINESLFEHIPPDVHNKLAPALQFFENIAPAGVLGYFLRRDSGKGYPLFSFRHLFLSHTLDDEMLIRIAAAISGKKMITLNNYSNRSKTLTRATVIPLKIAVNVRHGRRYLFAYNPHMRRFFSYRLDYIKNVVMLEECAAFERLSTDLENRLSATWGVFLGQSDRLEQVEMVLSIDEKAEAYVVARLKREGKHGTIEKIAANTFVFRIEVTDTMEMVPWLRTFIGRIISLKGSNEKVISQFFNDMERMVTMYEG